MFRRRLSWAALLILVAGLWSGPVPASADPNPVTWILLGGKGKASQVSGLQLQADPALERSIIYRLNALVWANGFIVSDQECPDDHFHGRLGDLQDRGKGCGLGTVARYDETPVPIQHASDVLMSNLAAGTFLSNVQFQSAANAAELARLKLLALKDALQTAGPQQFPTRRLALPAVTAALQSQTDARDILVRLSQQTSNRFAIRRAEQALKSSAKNTRRAFAILAVER